VSLLVAVCVLALVVVISWLLWKSGFLFEAETPQSVIDIPVADARGRKAFLKRLERWREEGKVTREEYEHLTILCERDWGT
jgi:hypothetical protein